MARPIKNKQVTALAEKYGINARRVRLIYREGMSELALKCYINEIKRTKTRGY